MYKADGAFEPSSIVFKLPIIKDWLFDAWAAHGRPGINRDQWKPIPGSGPYSNADILTDAMVRQCMADPEVQRRADYHYQIYLEPGHATGLAFYIFL